MLLGAISLLLFFVFVYAFVAGFVGVWLHNYLISTSKVMTEHTHDHRMCVYASIFWPIPLILLILIHIYKIIKFVYNFPLSIFSDISNRHKKLRNKND